MANIFFLELFLDVGCTILCLLGWGGQQISMTYRLLRRWAFKTAAPAESGSLFVAVSYSAIAYSSDVTPPPPGDWHGHLMAFVDMP